MDDTIDILERFPAIHLRARDNVDAVTAVPRQGWTWPFAPPHLGGPLAEMRKLWRFADERGFDWFSVSDHFQETPPQGGDRDCFESISTMAALAVETSRVRVACLVFCVGYRHPGVLAKALTTIDHLSGGRAECGIGAGWDEIEFAS